MLESRNTQSRKNFRRIVFISCLAIVVILVALLAQGAQGKSPQVEAYHSEAPKQDDRTLHLIHLLDAQLAEAEMRASDHTALELERQLEDLKDILSTRNEDKSAYENKIQELTDELEKSKRGYAALKKLNQPVIELKAKLQEAKKSLVKKDEMLKANMEIEEKRKLELQGQVAALKKEVDSLAHFKEENQTLMAALEENADTIESLEKKAAQKTDMLQSSMVLEEKNKQGMRDEIASLKKSGGLAKSQIDSLQTEIHDKNEIIKTLIAFEDKYKEEKKRRMIKEQIVDQLQAALNEQKNSLQKMESSRQDLTRELKQTQQTYSELIGQMGSRKQTPDFSSEVTDIESKIHLVQQGETLMKISEKYYGTTRKWKRILEANHAAIADENKIQPGTVLTIP